MLDRAVLKWSSLHVLEDEVLDLNLNKTEISYLALKQQVPKFDSEKSFLINLTSLDRVYDSQYEMNGS